MAELNENERKIVVKIVYYGPALSGKTTNLMQLHDRLNPRHRSDLMSFETRGDRTLFFDLLPLMVRSEGDFKIKLKLFTVPGQVAHDATRKAVLSRTDGVVFVADSVRDQSTSNFESFDNLEKNAARVGLDFDSLPLVIQFNKRDLENILPEKEILDRWTQTGLPICFSSALHGSGVTETLREILAQTYTRLNLEYALSSKYGVEKRDFLGLLVREKDDGYQHEHF
jgi:signal recognition particle receptor subunit beta